MSAELLRRAADVIESFAAEATPGSWNGHVSADGPHYGAVYGGPWENGYRMGNVMGWSEETVEEYGGEPSSADLRWLCLMSPHVAAPLVAWLRGEAASWDAPGVTTVYPAACAFARAVLGEELSS